MIARKITPYARQPPNDEANTTNTVTTNSERYKRRIPQSMANLCLEIAIACLFPHVSPLMLTRKDIDEAKARIQRRDAAHVKAVHVLSRLPEIFSYDTESVYGVTRFINWNSDESHSAQRQQALAWLSSNGVHERHNELRATKNEKMTPSEINARASAPQTVVPSDYHQKLTIAALQGLCANPAHATSFDDIADMAVQLAAGVIRLQEVPCER